MRSLSRTTIEEGGLPAANRTRVGSMAFGALVNGPAGWARVEAVALYMPYRLVSSDMTSLLHRQRVSPRGFIRNQGGQAETMSSLQVFSLRDSDHVRTVI